MMQKGERIHFDVRTRVILLLEMNFLLLWRSGVGYETALVGFCGMVLLLAGRRKSALRFACIFGGMVLVQMLVQRPEAFGIPPGDFSDSFLGQLVLFIVVSLRRFLPVLMLGSLVLATRVGEFVACMWQMKVPRDAILTISVVFRFFPTVREEWQAILASMKMRGIGFDFFHLLRRPLQTIEYLMVPLLINAVKISEELSEAALCRGLDCQGPHTSLIRVRMRASDYVFCLLPVVGAILLKVAETLG